MSGEQLVVWEVCVWSNKKEALVIIAKTPFVIVCDFLFYFTVISSFGARVL